MAKGIFSSGEMFEVVVKYMSIKYNSGIMGVKVFDEEDPKDVELMKKYEDKVQSLTTMWIQPNFKTNNEIARKCMVFDVYSGRRELDNASYREMIMEACLKKWDAQDEEGKVVPCKKEFFDKLDPSIALALSNKYLEATTMSEEEAKN